MGNEARIYRLALVRPLGVFNPVKWDDWPPEAVVMKVGKKLVQRSYAKGYLFHHNSKRRQAGSRSCFVVIRPGQTAHVGDYAARGIPEYDVA